VISSPSSERNTTSVGNLLTAFYQSLSLSQLERGWDLCLQVEEISCWKALGNKAIEMLNIDLAIRVYQKLGDACMVGSLESLRSIEDKYLLCGHIAVLYGNYSLAEENFLKSSKPYTAFEMRRNLGQWREAFLLVEEYFPGRLIETALILAKDLEIVGEYENVLTVIKRALPRDYTSHMHLKDLSPMEGYEALLKILAKAYLQTGDEKQGMLIAKKLRDEVFLHECTQNIRVCN
jgi:WD repeat-containing protein 19